MNYWLVKTEPETYSWEDLVKEGNAIWDGVRNFQARNYLKEMKVGDKVLVYYSGKLPRVIGWATVSMEAFPDPTDSTQRWFAIKIKAGALFDAPITLQTIKTVSLFKTSKIIKQTRLSVLPIQQNEWEFIVQSTKVQ